jgi:hypothetical protein
MKNINEILSKVELERISDKIILKAKISPQFYGEILKAFFSYTKIIEDTLNGKKGYTSDIGTFSYYQLGYGQITKFNGQIIEKNENDEDYTIIVKDEETTKPKGNNEGLFANIYEDAKSNNLIDIYLNTSVERAEKFLNYMDTSIFEETVIKLEEENLETQKNIFKKNIFKKKSVESDNNETKNLEEKNENNDEQNEVKKTLNISSVILKFPNIFKRKN